MGFVWLENQLGTERMTKGVGSKIRFPEFELCFYHLAV